MYEQTLTYSIPKPSLSTAAYALAGMIIIGLIGLGIAAYTAFAFIGRPEQALAFALIIEAGMISEAMALIRRNWLSIPGLIISLIVSGNYNFTQAQQAGALLKVPLTDPFQLAALSIGPLSAAFFLALALGFELRSHETAVHAWEEKRQKWMDDQAERTARRLERKEARAEKIALEASTRRVELGIEVPGISTPKVEPAMEVPRGTYEDFHALLSSNGHHAWKNAELAERFHVSTRTVTDWRAKYQEEHPRPQVREAMN